MKARPAVLWSLVALGLLALCAWGHAAILAAHGEQSYDNAVAVQFLHLALHGWGPSGIVGAGAFGDHFNPLFLLALPFYALSPGALVLQVLKSASLVCSLAGLALLSRELLGRGTGRWAVGVVLLSPMLWVSVFADYHSETLAAGLLPWLLLAYERRHLGWCLGLALAVALGKENLALVVGGLAVLALVERRGLPWILGLGAIGGLVFVLGVFVILPANAPAEGSGIGALLYQHLILPKGWGHSLSRPSLYRWLGFMLLSCGGLCLLAPRKLWPLVPLLLQHGLSAREAERLVEYHYLAPVLPLLAYAALAGAARFGTTPVVVDARRRVAVVALVLCNAILLVGVGPFERLRQLRTQHGVAELAARIPDNAPAWASLSTATRLASRDRLYMIESASLGKYLTRTWPFDPAQTTDVAHALIDVRDANVPPTLALRAVDAAGDCILIAPSSSERVVRPVAADPKRWLKAGSLRLSAGEDGRYCLAVQRQTYFEVPRLVLTELHHNGRLVERRPHRLLYGHAERAPDGQAFEAVYRHPYVLENPGAYELYVYLEGVVSPVLLTRWK